MGKISLVAAIRLSDVECLFLEKCCSAETLKTLEYRKAKEVEVKRHPLVAWLYKTPKKIQIPEGIYIKGTNTLFEHDNDVFLFKDGELKSNYRIIIDFGSKRRNITKTCSSYESALEELTDLTSVDESLKIVFSNKTKEQ